MAVRTYTRFEKARMVGARSLQIARGAPIMVKTKSTDPFKVAEEEFDQGTIPLDVRGKKPPKPEASS